MAVDAPRGAGVAQRISGWSVMAGLDLRQQQKLSQQLVMTQALQQAIKLLQLNHLELIEHVQTELLENPTLEEIPGTRVEVPTEVETRLQADSITQSKDIVEQSNGAEEGNLDWGRVLDDYSTSIAAALAAGADIVVTGRCVDSAVTLAPLIHAFGWTAADHDRLALGSLADHLIWQLGLAACTDGEVRAATVIIHNLDHRGWL